MAINKKNSSSLSETFMSTYSGMVSGVISVTLTLLLIVFPLICNNSYRDILETKYYFYRRCTLGMLILTLLFVLIMTAVDFMEFKGMHTRYLLSKIMPEDKKSPLFLTDMSVLVFWLSSAISTALSDYPKAAFWGNSGRYSGLLLISLYVVSYFLISRFWKPGRWHIQMFLFSGLILCIIGITDYFRMDILKFHEVILASQSDIFTSTIGNINTYTAYVGLIMGFSAAMFALEEDPLKSAWYYLCLCISFAAIIMGCSDNAYLSMAALFCGLPFLLFRTPRGILRYLVIIATFFTVIQIIHITNQLFPSRVIGLESLFLIIVNFRWLPVVVLFFWLLAAAYWLFVKNPDRFSGSLPCRFFLGGSKTVRLWAALMAIGLAAACFLFFDANAGGHAGRYGSLQSYLVFNDSWGTSRGYIWKKALELYGKFPLSQKLFGYGPDTFGLLTNEEILTEMIEATGLIFDSAHNSFLQYLLTIGLAGTAGYLAFLISSMYCMVKYGRKENYIFGALFAVACYTLQSTVNIDLPIVTPILWIMISIGIAGCRFTKTAPK